MHKSTLAFVYSSQTATCPLPQWPSLVELLRESSAPLPACVQQAFRQHEKSAKVMLLPAIKCACAAIDLQLFLWSYDRSGLPSLGYMASAALLIKPCLQPPAASISPSLIFHRQALLLECCTQDRPGRALTAPVTCP